jgi:hypothetical protein
MAMAASPAGDLAMKDPIAERQLLPGIAGRRWKPLQQRSILLPGGAQRRRERATLLRGRLCQGMGCNEQCHEGRRQQGQ